MLYFRKIRFLYPGNGKPKKSLIFWNRETPKIFFTFQETELSYTAEKGAFLYFLKEKVLFHLRKGIIRTLAYLELEAYSEPGYT